MMNREQTIIDSGITTPRPLAFDERNKPPDSALAGIRGSKLIAGQPAPESRAEPQFGIWRDGFSVQIIVAVWIEHAVGEDRGCQMRWLAEKGLQSARGP